MWMVIDMKDMTRALEIIEASMQPDPRQDLIKLLFASLRKTEELERASINAVELLTTMRFREWPKGTSEALGVDNMDHYDEVMMELERAVNNARRKTPLIRKNN
jgi:hypothetical protein